MCLIAWNWQPDSATPLLLIGNRDEFYARPARALQWWDAPHTSNSHSPLLAGQDLQAGGTWLGVTASGRLAALTNVRDPAQNRSDPPSRGELVTGFLQSTLSATDYLRSLQSQAAHYNPFNLLVFDGETLLGLHSATAQIRVLPTGLGAVSNADFETPWPKLIQLRASLHQQIAANAIGTDELLALLQNREIAADTQLPNTGIPLEWERSLSATYIATENYGTRASSVIKLSKHHGEFTEVRYDINGLVGRHTERW